MPKRTCKNKDCKKKFEQMRPNQVVCSPKCSYEYTRQLEEKKWKKRKKEIKEELLTVKDWVKIAQQAFNSYIRERDKDMNCISCDKKLKGKFDAGHFHNANNHWAIRYDEDNVHGQCVYCNQHQHSNPHRYREGILKRIGAPRVARIDKLSKETRKFTREELKDITKHYKDKLKELKNQEK